MPAKVLVADDSPTIRRRATTTLSEAGYEVTCVEDGQAAWNLLESGQSFTVLLCDILMPGLDGYELCRRVKADSRFAATPVLLLRGTFEPWDQNKAVDAGADGYVTKPFDGEALLSTLGEVLADVPSSAAVAAAPLPATAPILDEPAAPVLDAVAAPLEEAEPLAGGVPIALGEGMPEPEPLPVASAPMPESPLLDVATEDPLAAAPFGAEMPAASEPDIFGAGGSGPFGAPEPEAAPLDMPLALEPPPPVLAPPPEPPAPPAPIVAPEPAPLAAPAPAPIAPPPPVAAPVAAPAPIAAVAAAAPAANAGAWDDAMIERLAERVAARLTGRELEKIAWDVVPDVAEAVIRKRLSEIEAQLGDE